MHNYVKKLYADALAVMIAKNNDYSNNNENPFSNFEMVEELGITTPERGLMVRMTDKFSRASNLLSKEPDVQDESLQDTLMDLINYTAILSAYIESKRN